MTFTPFTYTMPQITKVCSHSFHCRTHAKLPCDYTISRRSVIYRSRNTSPDEQPAIEPPPCSAPRLCCIIRYASVKHAVTSTPSKKYITAAVHCGTSITWLYIIELVSVWCMHNLHHQSFRRRYLATWLYISLQLVLRGRALFLVLALYCSGPSTVDRKPHAAATTHVKTSDKANSP